MTTNAFSLADGASRIEVAVDFGCNLCSWCAEDRELIYRSDRFGTDVSSFYEGGGTPLLFPSVGRTWDRRESPAVPERYRIANGPEDLTMPVHGILPFGSWTLSDASGSASRIAVEYTFEYSLDVARRHYPFLVNYRQKFILERNAVTLCARLENVGTTPAPFAVGYHPYFRFYSDAVRIQLPCENEIELDRTLLVPTGGTTPFDGTLHVSASHECDVAFGGVSGTQATLLDEHAGFGIILECDRNVENYVIYSAPGEPFVCVEPWTRGLGAYEQLGDPGWEQSAALIMLQPGEAKRFQTTFRYAEIA